MRRADYRAGQAVYWTETKFDVWGRPTEVKYPDSNITTYNYSTVSDGTWIGLQTEIIDPSLKKKRYLNDAFGRLIRVEEPNSSGAYVETARYSYDVMNRMTTVQMGKRVDGTFKQTRTFVYNTKGQLTSATNPENGTVTYTYFADGLMESKLDAKSQRLWFVYDSSHRLLRIESPQGTTKTSFTYDTTGNPGLPTSYATGRMTSASNDGYTWHFGYDKMGRVTKQTMQASILGTDYYAQAQHAYDGGGRLQDIHYPGAFTTFVGAVAPGTQYRNSFDLAGRPNGLTHLDQGNWITDVQSVTYNAASQLTQWQEWGNTLTRGYSATRGWLTNLTASTALNISYGYYANGQVQTVTDAVNPGQSVSSYEYDELSRLKKATATNWALEWTYDEFGNRLTQSKVTGSSGTPPQITLAYGESTNRITTSGYQYDLNGNLTTLPAVNGQPALSISYDVFDRATTINSTTAKYDAFGRRVERILAGGTRRTYFYDPSGRLLAEYDNFTTQTRTVVYFAGHRLGQWTDRTGSVRYASGAYRHYYPFGEEVTSTASDQYKYAELYRDADTGLDYAVARYSSAAIGRFVSVDLASASALRPNEWNRYSYSANDPANLTDPWGAIAGEGVPPCTPYPICLLPVPFERLRPPVIEILETEPPGFGEALERIKRNQTVREARGNGKLLLGNQHCRDFLTKLVQDLGHSFASEGPIINRIEQGLDALQIEVMGNSSDVVLPQGSVVPPGVTTVAEYFNHPSNNSWAVTFVGTDQAFLSNRFFDGNASAQQAAVMLHETLHGSKFGFSDAQLATATGGWDPEKASATDYFSRQLFENCVTVKSNQ